MARFNHTTLERRPILLAMCILIVVSIGGIVELVPLFFLESTIEKVKGMRPYTPLELAGRNIYVRERCYNCHSQMIRTFRDEIERYGHYSLAAESMYDRPFQWGWKRTGPDLARVGGRYSDAWHVAHMVAPRSVVPGSVMPGYPFLARTPLDTRDLAAHLIANGRLGVPYGPEKIAAAAADARALAEPESDAIDGFEARYPGVAARDFDGNPALVSELDAVIAYLQMLGTLVAFDVYRAEDNLR